MVRIERFATTARASGIIRAGDRFETAGIVAEPGTLRDIVQQTRSVLDQLQGLVAKVGASRENIARVQIWLADMADFEAMNVVYDAWVDRQHQPVRACVGSQLASREYLIEIQAWGYL